jgi:hypothetical protein
MIPPISPTILLIMEDGEEANAIHILGKYHFANSVRKIRRADEAKAYFAQLNTGVNRGDGKLPELIIVSMAPGNLTAILGASRQGIAAQVPMVIMAGSREEEEAIRSKIPANTYVLGKPLGFFKLLEAMQKLGMFWMVLRSPTSMD